MLRALWLTSWYPNRLDMQNGDFIQRHARAAAMHCSIDVIHLEPDKNDLLKTSFEKAYNKEGNLSETIILYKLSKGIIGKIISYFSYINRFKKEIEKYIKERGLPDIVHVHVPMKSGLLALWLKRKYNIPFVVTEHWNIYKSQAKDEFYTRNFLFKYYTKKIFHAASLVLPVSNDLGKRICKTVGDINFEAVPNSVDTSLFNYRDKNKNEAFTFIHASTLNYPKNPEALLRAFIQFNKKYAQSKLLVLGEVSEALNDFIQKENISSNQKIIFKGLVPYNDVAVYMQQSHALLMFSRYENMPCVVLEALCCGLPVVSSSVGGIPEVVNEDNGILTENYSTDELILSMEKLYNDYSKFNQHIISSLAIEKFSYSSIGKMIYEKYKAVLRN